MLIRWIYRLGMMRGASETQKSLMDGAIFGLTDDKQNELAAELNRIKREMPVKHGDDLRKFTNRSREIGEALATLNRIHGRGS